MFLNTINRRFADIPQVQVNDSDCSALGGMRCKASAFKAECGSTSEKVMSVDISQIFASSTWQHFSPESLTMKQLALARALLLTAPSDWKSLWLGVFMVSGMFVTRGEDVSLVLLATPHMCFGIGLTWVDELLGYQLCHNTLWQEFTVTTWDDISVHDASAALTDNLELVFTLGPGQPMVEYILRNTVHLYNAVILRKVCWQRSNYPGPSAGVAIWFFEGVSVLSA